MFKCCFKTKEQKEYLLHKKTCPYCNFVFKNEYSLPDISFKTFSKLVFEISE